MKKRLISLLLTGTMVLGMNLTVLASEPFGTATGTASSEGIASISTESGVASVTTLTLPTSAANTDTFNYIPDPQRLLKQSNYSRFGGSEYLISGTTNDSSVYWMVGTKTDSSEVPHPIYANHSKELSVINKSIQDVKVTVTATSTNQSTVGLATTEAMTDGQIYLALKVGSRKSPISKTSTVSETRKLEKKLSNFDITWNTSTNKYEYTPKSGTRSWNAINFSLLGACSEFNVTEATVFPNVVITWDYSTTIDTADVDGVYDTATGVSSSDRLNESYMSLSTGKVTFNNPGYSVQNVYTCTTRDGANAIDVTIYASHNSSQLTIPTQPLREWYNSGYKFIKISYTNGSADIIEVKE